MLSKRLLTVAELAGTGECVADIGTDHGHVPVFLVSSGRYRRAIASDIGAGPLARAAENIRAAGLADRIEARLGPGLSTVQPGEADTVVITGMGGLLIVRILTEGAAAAGAACRLVLSPQSEYREFRRYLTEQDWRICREVRVREDEKDYIVFTAERGKTPAYSETELRYGRASCMDRETLRLRREALLRERQTAEKIRRELIQAGTEAALRRLGPLEQQLAHLDAALAEGAEEKN